MHILIKNRWEKRVNRRIRQQLTILCMGLVLLLMVAGADQKDREGKMPKKTEEEAKGTEAEEEMHRAEEETGASQSQVPADNPNIRVLICSDNYTGNYHEQVVLKCSGRYQVAWGGVTEEHGADELVTIERGDPWLALGSVTLTPLEEGDSFSMPELQRACDTPSYVGSFQVEEREEGLIVVNELPLESYLCSVVPSEMPSSYPMEALKAQAVCARTYARQQMNGNREAEFGADVDDSVSYQVYNNIGQNERTTQAVRETAGQVMRDAGGNLIDAWYFSTSCGLDLSQDFSQESVFCASMDTVSSKAYEKEEPWYRWKAFFSQEELTRLANLKEPGFGTVTGMYVKDREKNGAIQTLVVQGGEKNMEIEGEYAVRKLLQTDQAGVTLQDGSQGPDLGMLPSAFFYLTPQNGTDGSGGYQLTGGGYGHGKGMSQNGAKHMAEAGKSCREILKYYYGDIQIG